MFEHDYSKYGDALLLKEDMTISFFHLDNYNDITTTIISVNAQDIDIELLDSEKEYTITNISIH